MQHMLDWDELQIFHQSAQHGSLDRAARVLDIHRSTVRRRIEHLEAEIDQKVLERESHGFLLTAAGERLLERTERIATATDDLIKATDRDSSHPAGAIRVGATFNLAFGLLPDLLAGFRDHYPERTIELIATADGCSPLQPDETDISFRTLEPGTEAHNEMVGRRIGRLQVAVSGTQRYLKKTAPPRSAADLAGHRLILGGENLSHIASAKWLKKVCKSAEPVYRAISMLPMLAAVRNGMGLASVPFYLGDAEEGLIRLLDLIPCLLQNFGYSVTHITRIRPWCGRSVNSCPTASPT